MQPEPLSRWGEFAARTTEADYRNERLPESRRQLRLVLLCSLVVNSLFYLNDLHFYGQPHFAVAIGARTTIEAATLAGFFLLREARDFVYLQRLSLAWMMPVVIAGAVLVDPHTDTALFVTFALPALFYLALPLSVLAALGSGLSSSMVLLAAYMSSAALDETGLGQVLGMLTLNVILVLVLTGSNRLRRQEWAATKAERAANKELSDHREMLRGLLRAVPTPLIIMAQESHLVFQVNDAARQYFGDEVLRGRLSLENYLDERDLDRLTGMLQATGSASGFETSLCFPDGHRRDVLLEATKAEFGGADLILASLIDITERKEMEAHLKRLATTDPLTGLANRTRFFVTAAAEIKRMRRYGQSLAVLMVDIDFFKRINDTLGHDAGDTALCAFAELCRNSMRGQDAIARLGGEEFALLLPETDKLEALALAERLRVAVAEQSIDTLGTTMTVSIGLAEIFEGEETIDAALTRADQALYVAKNSGRNRVVRFDGSPLAAKTATAGD